MARVILWYLEEENEHSQDDAHLDPIDFSTTDKSTLGLYVTLNLSNLAVSVNPSLPAEE